MDKKTVTVDPNSFYNETNKWAERKNEKIAEAKFKEFCVNNEECAFKPQVNSKYNNKVLDNTNNRDSFLKRQSLHLKKIENNKSRIIKGLLYSS